MIAALALDIFAWLVLAFGVGMVGYGITTMDPDDRRVLGLASLFILALAGFIALTAWALVRTFLA